MAKTSFKMEYDPGWFAYTLVSCAVNFVVRNCASCLWLIGISGAMLIDWVEAVDGIVDWIELALW